MKPASVILGILVASIVPAPSVAAGDGSVRLGLGTYYTRARPDLPESDVQPPVARFRSGSALREAAPTNQWYSSVMFERWSRPIHAHPMTYRASPLGFEIGLPSRRLEADQRTGKVEVRYDHDPAIIVSPAAFRPRDARLSGHSDWLARIRMADASGNSLTATVLHGSPFSYFECTRGDVVFLVRGLPDVIADSSRTGGDPRVAAFTTSGHSYAVFAPTGASWQWTAPGRLRLHLPRRARFFAVAGLPDASPETLKSFLGVAYAFPTETRVEWRYDEVTSRVRTTFTVDVVAKEGRGATTFMGLYPHQWAGASPAVHAIHEYDSVRGPIRVIAANSFSTELTYHGFVPYWGPLQDAADRTAVSDLLATDATRADALLAPQGRGAYWFGKALGAVSELMNVADAAGDTDRRNALLHVLEARMETWFDGRHENFFMQSARLGTFIGYPEEYNSISNMNDHHFHYGYWIMAAAQLALRDPAWVAPSKWGAMVDKLVADVATTERGRRDFPFLRNFDPYEGHSWASGLANYDAGDNQESSSEATHAWAGLLLLGEATGNRALRDLGIYLYATEIAAIDQYWFDLDHQVLAPEFGKPFASVIFGGKYAYNTWWTREPRQVLGINLLPITTASTYLGRDPAYVRRLVEGLPAAEKAYAARGLSDGTPPDVWQEVIASFLALADPGAGRALWNPKGTVEFGETRSHTLYWLSSLCTMGTPDLDVTADTALYAVFRDRGGDRTYLAYNATDLPRRVRFSTGKVLDVPPRSLARER